MPSVFQNNREGRLAKGDFVEDETGALARSKLFIALQAIIILCLFLFLGKLETIGDF